MTGFRAIKMLVVAVVMMGAAVPAGAVAAVPADARKPILERARRIVSIARSAEDPLDRIVALAAEATDAGRVGAHVLGRSATTRDAVVALLTQRGVEVPWSALSPLGSLPPALDAAVARVVDAFSWFAAARGNQERLGSRLALVEAAAALTRLGATAPRGWNDGLPVQLPSWLSLELEGTNTLYPADQHYMLSIDVGGDDTYLNAAGGTGGTLQHERYTPSYQWCQDPLFEHAAAIDVSGSDRYGDGADCGRNGGAGGRHLRGFLFDGAGDDRYTAGSGGTNGGGGPGWAAGGGDGALFDVAGNDEYRAGSYGANGGAATLWHEANGLLVDGDGSDVYEAGDYGVNGGWAPYVNGSGSGMLVDARGDDRYKAGSRGTNGGQSAYRQTWEAPSTSGLIDGEGDDEYTAGNIGTNGGIVAGSTLSFPAVPGLMIGVALLYDGAGDDVYLAGGHATNGGADAYMWWPGGIAIGLGALVDLSGDDAYVGRAPFTNGGAAGDTYFFAHAAGLLLDGSGTDSYNDPAVPGGAANDCSIVAKERGGMQLDVASAPCA